jgi:hypothetical protein
MNVFPLIFSLPSLLLRDGDLSNVFLFSSSIHWIYSSDFCGATSHVVPRPPHCFWFLDHTQTHVYTGRTPPDGWSATTWQQTTITKDRHPCPQRDWNLRSQQ